MYTYCILSRWKHYKETRQLSYRKEDRAMRPIHCLKKGTPTLSIVTLKRISGF